MIITVYEGVSIRAACWLNGNTFWFRSMRRGFSSQGTRSSFTLWCLLTACCAWLTLIIICTENAHNRSSHFISRKSQRHVRLFLTVIVAPNIIQQIRSPDLRYWVFADQFSFFFHHYMAQLLTLSVLLISQPLNCSFGKSHAFNHAAVGENA